MHRLEEWFAEQASVIDSKTGEQKAYMATKHIHTAMKQLLLDSGVKTDQSLMGMYRDSLSLTEDVKSKRSLVQFRQSVDDYKSYLHGACFEQIKQLSSSDPSWFEKEFDRIGFKNVFDNPLWNLSSRDKARFDLLGIDNALMASIEANGGKRKIEDLLDGSHQIVADSDHLNLMSQPRDVIMRYVRLMKRRATLAYRYERVQKEFMTKLRSISVGEQQQQLLQMANPAVVWSKLQDTTTQVDNFTRTMVDNFYATARTKFDLPALSLADRTELLDQYIKDIKDADSPNESKLKAGLASLEAGLAAWAKAKYRREWHKEILNTIVVERLGEPLTDLYNETKDWLDIVISYDDDDGGEQQPVRKKQKTAVITSDDNKLPAYMKLLLVSGSTLDQWTDSMAKFHEEYSKAAPQQEESKVLEETRSEVYFAAAQMDATLYLSSLAESLKLNPYIIERKQSTVIPKPTADKVAAQETKIISQAAKSLNDTSLRSHQGIVSILASRHKACQDYYETWLQDIKTQLIQAETTLPPYEPWMDQIAISQQALQKLAKILGSNNENLPTTLTGVLAASGKTWFKELCRRDGLL
jgi:hypothetical protein